MWSLRHLLSITSWHGRLSCKEHSSHRESTTEAGHGTDSQWLQMGSLICWRSQKLSIFGYVWLIKMAIKKWRVVVSSDTSPPWIQMAEWASITKHLFGSVASERVGGWVQISSIHKMMPNCAFNAAQNWVWLVWLTIWFIYCWFELGVPRFDPYPVHIHVWKR